LRGEPLDVRADIYAVGATLYYLLTGRPPLEASDLRELVSKVASEKPQSPRLLRRDIPGGVAAIVLRCLAKAPVGRPQSYADLADRLRPYGSAEETPAPLGARLIAWIVDAVLFAMMTWVLTVSAWTAATPGWAPTLLQLAGSPWLTGTIYYFVLEGGWGASLGKRLMGLRVTAPTGDRWWLRLGLRTAVFQLPIVIPTLVFMDAISGSTIPGVVYTGNPAPNGWSWNAPPDAWLTLLLTVLLFSTARRGNGWTGLHEVLSGTRVVQRTALRSRTSAAPKASPAELVQALSSPRRVGPYAILTTVGDTVGGALSVGIDPILRRYVWIHEGAPGTAAVGAIRRDISRPGRLHWLAGRRSPTENWDAFEAPDGELLLLASSTSDWREMHRSLSSLAIELDASAREGTDGPLNLAQVWKRPDGQLVLLDVPWPGLAASEAKQYRAPVDLLAAVAKHRMAPGSEPFAPLSATTLITRLEGSAPPALADVKAELLRLASIPSRPSRLRRALPMVMATMPVALLVMIVTVMLPLAARSIQEDPGNIFRQRSELMTWLSWIAESGADAELTTEEQRSAAEQYLAAHFRAQLTSHEFWHTQTVQIEPILRLRRTAAEIAARYPAVSPEDLARASEILAPQIEDLAARSANVSENFPAGGKALWGFVANGFASIPILVSILGGLVSVLAVPGGLITRAFRHAVVSRDAREIGRVRSAVRFLVAWSPALAWIACVGAPMFGAPRVSPDVAFIVGSLAFLVMAGGAAWTIAAPARGPHDRIAGTWVVPR
jgi:uncharacterized RDD family membrane protein YckC